ncbi:unnamed protein product [Withania somnifera]
MDDDNSSPAMYLPCVEEAQRQQLNEDAVSSVKQCNSVQDMDGKQLVGVLVPVSTDAAANSPAKTPMTNGIVSAEKTKRGRPPRGEAAKGPQPKRQREEEREKMFALFVSMVVLLSYAIASWHVCSVCQKASQFMCYTCTYSVCKGCKKNADFFCVRENKGFCSTCMRVIMLIENIDQGIKEMVQVDFDDKSSWEYLFKVYWMYLKEKLSLTQSELIQAKNPWKEPDVVHAKQQRLPFGHPVAFGGKGIGGKSFDHLEVKQPKQLPVPPCKDPPITEIQTIAEAENLSGHGCNPQLEHRQLIELELHRKDSLKKEEPSASVGTSLNGPPMEWASKELLEFVAHMKNDDTSTLSHFEVQTLLLEYIKRNNLRDPHQKSQIICDSRLKSLFGKHRAGHIEMLKLLEFHILIKEDSHTSAFIPTGIIGNVTRSVKVDDNNAKSFLMNKTKKHKSRRRSEESLVQINPAEYAAIDAHNINLIYLRRDLMESLIEDMEKFQGRVIGSVVRIRISGNNQKQDMYRLVHVIGTRKACVPYNIRDKTADVLLEVLNLNKKEIVPVDSISNQDFSEDERRRLRQIIKCGLVKRLTVGEVQKKAIELRAVKLNDSLEEEILRLKNLHDRASEKGRKKELRECVEKLELLKTPEEHQRRLLAIPEVHADPKMDPNYVTEEDARESDDKKQVEYGGPRYTRFSRREGKCMSSWRKEAHGKIMKKLGNQGTACQVVDRSASETSITSFSTVNSMSTNDSDTDKLWHYRDPNGRTQGPFSVTQLRKWNRSGLFPLDMRIWTNDEHYDSVLLTNALKGLFHKTPQVHGEISHQSQERGAASVDSSVGWCRNPTETGRECGESEVPWRLRIANHSKGKMDGLSSSTPQCLDLNNSYSDILTTPCSPEPSSSHGSHGKRCHEIVNFQSSTGHMVQDSSGSIVCQISDGCNHSMLSHDQRHLGQSSGQNWGSSNSNRSPVNINSGSNFSSATNSSDSSEQKGIMGYPDPSPTPKTSYEDVEAQAAEELLSLSLVVPVCASNIQDFPSPIPDLEDEAPVGQSAANKDSSTSSFPVQDSGPSWSSASSLVIYGAQLPEIANGLDGYPAAAKPSMDSDLISDSALKPSEAVGDHVDTPTSDANQLDHNSSSYPISNFSNWQGIFGEPIEFSTLDEESVSDLLAEVDAMESQTQSGMVSPTSAMRCCEETISLCRSDFFSFFEEFSPVPDPAKNDSLSSTEDIQLPCQSSLTDELAGTSHAEASDPLQRSSRTSSSEGETKSADVSFSRGELVSVISQSTELEAITTDCRAAPGNTICSGPVQGFTNVNHESSMVNSWGRSNMNCFPFTGNPLSDGPRDWVIPVGDSGFGRNRSLWCRQPRGGRGYSEPPPKGQRFENFMSGHCKEGLSCDYLHI